MHATLEKEEAQSDSCFFFSVSERSDFGWYQSSSLPHKLSSILCHSFPPSSMSTPVSVDPAPIGRLRTESEQERDLQAQVLHMIDLQYQQQKMSEQNNGFVSCEENLLHDDNQDDPQAKRIGMAKRTTTQPMDLSAMGIVSEPPPNRGVTPPFASVTEDNLPNSHGIGKGTLYFSNEYQNNYRDTNQPTGVAAAAMTTTTTTTTITANIRNPPPRDTLQLNPVKQVMAGYGAVPEQHHEFYYGNPDYHDPYNHSAEEKDGNSAGRSLFVKFCCLIEPLINLLSLEQLQRSFCYGAIDGMLTGSGIVSAFCGLGILTVHSPWETRLAVLAFSTAACVADSLCMAIGHIWTCYVVSSSHAQERSRERLNLHTNKSDAKGKLVDMLLARGMLKIDAMSLADTLEGYPDLFVSTIVGDSLVGVVDEADDDDSGNLARPDSASGSGPGFGSWNFPSYGRLDDIEADPEITNVNMVVLESQREGLFMMMGFAIFALVPSLLWLYLPLAISPPVSEKGHPMQGQAISLPSVVVSLSAIVMWTLGVWKSSFLDSNWVIFGIETVVVLLICVMSAFGVGSALSSFLANNIDVASLLKVN